MSQPTDKSFIDPVSYHHGVEVVAESLAEEIASTVSGMRKAGCSNHEIVSLEAKLTDVSRRVGKRIQIKGIELGVLQADGKRK